MTAHTGPEYSFLGMRIIVAANGIDVDMIAHLLKILEGKVSGSRVTYPAYDGLLHVNDSSPTLAGGASKVFILMWRSCYFSQNRPDSKRCSL